MTLRFTSPVALGALLASLALLAAPAHAQNAPPPPDGVGSAPLPPAIPGEAAAYDLGLSQKAWEKPQSNLGKGQLVPGYVSYRYTWARTYQVQTRVGISTSLRIDPSETITNVILADPTAFEVTQFANNVVEVRPLATGIDTSLKVRTLRGRLYSYYIRSVPPDSERITDFTVDVVLAVPPGSRPAEDASGGPHSGVDETTQPIAPRLPRPGEATEGLPSGTQEPLQEDPLPGMQGRLARVFDSEDPALAPKPASARPSPGSPGGILDDLARNSLRIPHDESEWGNLEELPFDPGEIRFDVKAFANSHEAARDIGPVRAWSDCCWIYADYGGKASTMQRWPVATRLTDGTEQPVPQRVAGKDRQILVVETLGDVVLRSGDHVVCLRRHRPDRPEIPPIAVSEGAMIPISTFEEPVVDPDAEGIVRRGRLQAEKRMNQAIAAAEKIQATPSTQVPGTSSVEVSGSDLSAAKAALEGILKAEGTPPAEIETRERRIIAHGISYADAVRACRLLSSEGLACTARR